MHRALGPGPSGSPADSGHCLNRRAVAYRHAVARAAVTAATVAAALLLAACTSSGPSPAPSGSASSSGGSGPGGSAQAEPGIHKIRHVVIIMQENRSFDSYFGTYPGADGIPMKNGVPTVCSPDPLTRTCVKPYHDTSDRNAGGPHDHIDAMRDINGGLMNGFVRSAVSGLIGHSQRPATTRRSVSPALKKVDDGPRAMSAGTICPGASG